MRVPEFSRFSSWLQGLGLLAAGFIIGGAVYMSLHIQNYDYLIQQTKKMEKKITDLEEVNHNLSKIKNPDELKKIDIQINNPTTYPELDEVTKAELQQRTKEELKFMIGQPVKELAPEHIKRLFGRKIITIESTKDNYLVEIQSIFIANSEMRVWMLAKPYFSM